MQNMRPVVFFLLSFLLLWLGIFVGSRIQKAYRQLLESEDRMITVIQGGLITLLGLLIGFTFSMAVARHDNRIALIVKEANAIGTTWLRSATLEEPARTQTQELLRKYVSVRQDFLGSGNNQQEFQQSLAGTSDLQARLWSIASDYALSHRDPITGLYLSTLNDSIDATEERLAAFENRVPEEAWVLLLFIGFASTVFIGMKVGSHSSLLSFMLPLVIAGAIALALDVDSPRYGFVRPAQPSMDRLELQITGTPPNR
jgi:hypothetical protein